jgi:hypothetical protein
VSEPLIAFRETVLAASEIPSNAVSGGGGTQHHHQQQQVHLPPPWSEIPELASARLGKFRLVSSAGNVAVSIRAFPLHASCIRALEDRPPLAVAKINEYITVLQRQLQTTNSSSSDVQESAQVKDFFHQLDTAVYHPRGEEVEDEVVDPALLTASFGAPAGARSLRDRVLSVASASHPTNLFLLAPDAIAEVWRSRVPPPQQQQLQSASGSSSTGGKASSVFSAVDEACGAAIGAGAGAGEASGRDNDSVLVGQISLTAHAAQFYKLWSRLHSACTAAFRMASEAGPLMREPLHGVGFCVEKVEVSAAVCISTLSASECEALFERDASLCSAQVLPEGAQSTYSQGSASILTGQLISEMKDAMHASFLSLPVRVVEPVYRCHLQCDQSQLGNLYAVLAQRRGVVTEEDIIEGTSLFLLTAHLPVHSSFGFAQQLLKKTSGQGTAPQLSFSHWSRIEADPFWRPTSEEELEEYGESGTTAAAEQSLPRTIIDAVRKRKGMATSEKIVMFAEKQRTLNKKK